MAVPLQKLQGVREWFALLIGTALGAGLIPLAPGTMGSLVAVPLVWWMSQFGLLTQIGTWTVLSVVGIWAARVIDQVSRSSDNSSIVIDEVVGYWVTAATAHHHWKTIVASFILFRIFDVLKPPPVRAVDRWSKKQPFWGKAFGVIADDVLAGFQGLALILFLQKLQVLP